MTTETCQLHKYDEHGKFFHCGNPAVVVWKSRDEDLSVCEECRKMIDEVAKSSGGTAVYELFQSRLP